MPRVHMPTSGDEQEPVTDPAPVPRGPAEDGPHLPAAEDTEEVGGGGR